MLKVGLGLAAGWAGLAGAGGSGAGVCAAAQRTANEGGGLRGCESTFSGTIFSPSGYVFQLKLRVSGTSFFTFFAPFLHLFWRLLFAFLLPLFLRFP